MTVYTGRHNYFWACGKVRDDTNIYLLQEFSGVSGNEGPKAPEGRQELGQLPGRAAAEGKGQSIQADWLKSSRAHMRSANAASLDKCRRILCRLSNVEAVCAAGLQASKKNNMFPLKCIIVQGSSVCSWILCAIQQ
eukprot:1144451-Pelagomonas_calceolata.AAC.3